MILDRITITGADHSICPSRLLKLSDKYPQLTVEWGILVSRDKQGVPRYPSMTWVQELQNLALSKPINLSLHICGAWTRHLLQGINGIPTWLLDGFQRLQFNFRAKHTDCDVKEFYRVLTDLSKLESHKLRQSIFQLDHTASNAHYEALLGLLAVLQSKKIDPVPLFDISGGRGVTPESWLAPPSRGLCGYAGGLGPENLAENLNQLADIVGDRRIWVDMETKVRSDNDMKFDLLKVDECLEIASSHSRIS